jgi:outer membrane autotransporter protein
MIAFDAQAADCNFSGGDTITGTCELPTSPGLTVSGSQAIIVTGAAAQTTSSFVSGSLRNSGVISGTTDGIRNTVGTLGGFISSGGTISGAENAINLTNMTRFISNTGTISSSGGVGIRVTSGILAGGIVNDGLISGVTEAIRIDRARFEDFSTFSVISNFGTITATGGDAFRSGNSLAGAATSIVGSINNYGLISGNRALVFDGGTSQVGSIRNSISGDSISGFLIGEIAGTNTGIHIGSTSVSSTISGSIQNQGLIRGGNTGIYIQNGDLTSLRNYGGTITGSLANSTAVWISQGQIVDGISNSGTIGGTASGSTAIKIGDGTNAGTVGGAFYIPGITNSGTIGLGTVGIDIRSGSELTDSLVNSGTISADVTAIQVLGTLANNLISGDAIVNSGTISGLSDSAIRVGSGSLAGTISGSISNTGLISGNSAIVIEQNGTLAGQLTNDGTIAGSASSYGLLNSGSMTGGIQNNGLIYGGPSGRSGTAIGVLGSDALSPARISSGITNVGTISGESGIFVNEYGTIAGGISNSGYILAQTLGLSGGGSAISVLGLVSGSGGRASIINTATIDGGTTGSGIAIGTSYAGTLSGSIQNSGTIEGGISGIQVFNGTIIGGITNSASGVISGSQANSSAILIAGGYGTATGGLSGGIRNLGTIGGATSGARGLVIGDGTFSNTVSGGLTNSGTIGRGSLGIDIQNLSSLTGGLANAGTIAGSTTAVNVLGVLANNGTGNAITNSGLITSSAGSAINVGGTVAGTISGSIQNSGQITGATNGIQVASNGVINGQISNAGTITGGNALNLLNTTNSFVINNSGVLDGNVLLGINTLNLNDVGSVINGSISGGTASQINLTGAFTNSNAVNSIEVGSLNIQSGATLNLVNPITLIGTSPLLNNAGTLVLAAGATQTLTGNYSQASGAVLTTGLASASSYGKLVVDGNASLSSGSEINVNVIGSPSIPSNTTLSGIISATGTLTATPSTITVTDNSALLDFSLTASASSLDLIARQSSANNFISAVQGNNNPSAVGAATTLQALSTSGSATWDPVFTAFNQMATTEQVSNGVSQTVPVLVGAGSQATATVMQNFNDVIDSRTSVKQGLVSKEEFIGNQEVWLKPLGSWAEQNQVNNVAGYRGNTGGLILGVDRAISQKTSLGLAFVFANSNLSSNSAAAPSSLNINSYQAGAYGHHRFTPSTMLNYQADIGINQNKGSRSISFMGTTANSSYDSYSSHLGLGLNHHLQGNDRFTLIPLIRADYIGVMSNAYTEDGAGPLSLRVNQQNYSQVLMTTGAKAEYALPNRLKIVGNLTAGYNVINQPVQISSSFVGGGSSFTTNGLSLSPWLYSAGLGLVGKTEDNIDLSIRYDIQTSSSGYFNQIASARVRFLF